MMRNFCCRALITVAIAAVPSPVEGQEPWRLSYFPYLNSSPNDGVMGMARAIWFQQADYGERTTLRRSLAIDAGISTHESWLARATYADPTIADGWRLHVVAEAGRQPRFGNEHDPIERERQLSQVEVTRRIVGPLHFAVRGGVRRDEFDGDVGTLIGRYPRTSFDLNSSFTRGNITQTDATVRTALVLDLRDREFDVNRGVLAEVGVMAGSAGEGYEGVYGHLRGYVSPRPGTRVTARGAFRALSGTDAVAALHELPQWESAVTTLGGHGSHRGFGEGQLVGRGLLLGGLEVRHDIINLGDFGAITALAFADGGRVFSDILPPLDITTGPRRSPGRLRLTTDDWEIGGGGGIAIRVLRSATVTITAARGNGETRWYTGTGWSW